MNKVKGSLSSPPTKGVYKGSIQFNSQKKKKYLPIPTQICTQRMSNDTMILWLTVVNRIILVD
jgi:hypothetical protein